MSKQAYEPAGGVVPIEWREGGPDNWNEYGEVLLEIWSAHLTMGWRNRPYLTVKAKIQFAKWNNEEWIDSNGKPISQDDLCRSRRWARLSSRYTYQNVTLKVWGPR